MQTIFDFFQQYGPISAGGVLLLGILAFIALLKSLYYICAPNELLVFSGGRKTKLPDGSVRGFRVAQGGGWRTPIVGKVDRISLALLEVPISVRGAFSKGGIALNVDAIANVKISNDPVLVSNAIERFLGRDKNEVRRVAKETLEGHLRGVLARLTPEEVNEDRLKFAEELSVESEHDLSKLGIQLDTLKIQHVSDDKGYLDSIGRVVIANVIRDAEIAESDAEREAELAEASNRARGNVKVAEVEAQIARLRNDLRRIQAELESTVNSEEERTKAAAREARAKAEQELQAVRAELEAIRLQCDQVIPAEAARQAQELIAKGDAALLRERGYAISEALELMNSAWKEAGESALAIYLIEDIEKILGSAAKGVGKVKIQELHMIDGGDGKVLAGYINSYPEMLKSVLAAVKDTTGIDVADAISAAKTEAEK
jgi:flotillin